MSKRIPIGVSACLLGEQVRYDGGHKRAPFVTDVLGRLFELVPICPEVGAGLGTPRPPVRLVGDPERPRVVGVADPTLDVTAPLERFSQETVARLGALCGYVLKKDSPSCGMARVKLYPQPDRAAERKGVGLFARALIAQWPLLPVEEEGRLNDAALRENFVARVYTLHRWHELGRQGLTAARLIDFHSRHKYLVMAHSQAAYQRMGRLLSNLKGADLDAVGAAYIEELMHALKRVVSRRRHVNVLQHILGYFKQRIDAGDKAEMVRQIEAYRQGEVPLVVPITLLRHHLRREPDPYIERQYYLEPYPEGLGLRNHV